VLSGGGAYAAYEVGVLRALMTGVSPATGFVPIDAEVLAGTSAGAVNAAIMAMDSGDGLETLDYLERAWITRLADQPETCVSNVLRIRANPINLFSAACLSSGAFFADLVGDVAFLTQETTARGEVFLRSSSAVQDRVLETLDLGVLITAEPLRRSLGDLLDVEKVRRSRRTLRIAATNWRTGELRVFQNEDMTEADGLNVIMASSALPGVFPSVEIGNEPYVDGGVVMNTPLRPAIEAGATALHVIYVDPDVHRVSLPRHRNTLNTLYRTLVITFGLTVSRDIRMAEAINKRLRRNQAAAFTTVQTGERRPRPYRPLTIHRYHPTDDLGGTFRWLDFDRDHIVRLIARGYEDARHHDCAASRCVLERQGQSRQMVLASSRTIT
jgi:NTE family protein